MPGRAGSAGSARASASTRCASIGDVGYVVTFRQIDPLYTVDLADPERPRVLGELKIPGYSAYLHPVGEDLLLGVGQDVTERGPPARHAALALRRLRPAPADAAAQGVARPGLVGGGVRPPRASSTGRARASSSLPFEQRAVGFRVGRARGIDAVGRIEHERGKLDWTPGVRRSLVVRDSRADGLGQRRQVEQPDDARRARLGRVPGADLGRLPGHRPHRDHVGGQEDDRERERQLEQTVPLPGPRPAHADPAEEERGEENEPAEIRGDRPDGEPGRVVDVLRQVGPALLPKRSTRRRLASAPSPGARRRAASNSRAGGAARRLATTSAAEPARRPPTRIIAPSTCRKSGRFQLSGRIAATTLTRPASRSCRRRSAGRRPTAGRGGGPLGASG